MEQDKYLEPCPFCGSKAAISILPGFFFGLPVYQVECINCDAKSGIDSTPQNVTIKWNHRT